MHGTAGLDSAEDPIHAVLVADSRDAKKGTVPFFRSERRPRIRKSVYLPIGKWLAGHGRGIFLGALALFSSGCSLTSSEIHLAPIFSLHRNAYGDTSWEAIGGLLEGGRRAQREEFALHPLYLHTKTPEGVTETDFLYPLGYGRNDGKESGWRFLPFYWWKDRINEKGKHDVDWMLLPFFFGGSSEDGEDYFAFFPFFGVLRNFLSYERLRFFLFPLYSDTEKENGRKSWNLFWPFFGWGEGGGQRSLRIFPFYNFSGHDGRYAKYSILWPFFHFGWTEMDGKDPGFYFLFFPLFGWSHEKNLRSWTILPPFLFGRAENEKTGYSSYDFLWPLGKVERGGNQPERTRFLPFFAFFDGQEVKSRCIVWPVYWAREEKGPHYKRTSYYLLPFWEWWEMEREKTEDDAPAEEDYWHAWPLAHRERGSDGTSDLAIPSPIFFRSKAPRFEENYSVLWTLYRQRTGKQGEFSARGFLDLYRREAGHGEDRFSVPLLFGRRAKDDGTTEWSFLAGLLRFRSPAEGGMHMMAPSFPGPGWE